MAQIPPSAPYGFCIAIILLPFPSRFLPLTLGIMIMVNVIHVSPNPIWFFCLSTQHFRDSGCLPEWMLWLSVWVLKGFHREVEEGEGMPDFLTTWARLTSFPEKYFTLTKSHHMLLYRRSQAWNSTFDMRLFRWSLKIGKPVHSAKDLLSAEDSDWKTGPLMSPWSCFLGTEYVHLWKVAGL